MPGSSEFIRVWLWCETQGATWRGVEVTYFFKFEFAIEVSGSRVCSQVVWWFQLKSYLVSAYSGCEVCSERLLVFEWCVLMEPSSELELSSVTKNVFEKVQLIDRFSNTPPTF